MQGVRHGVRIVDVQILEPGTENSTPRGEFLHPARVTRVLYTSPGLAFSEVHTPKAGEVIYLWNDDECRAAPLPGQNGVAILYHRTDERYSFNGFLSPLDLQILREEGLIPPEKRKRCARRGQ